MPDRFGEPETRKKCRNPNCRPPGWLGTDDEGRPIPCMECKDHLLHRRDVNDFAERTPSARAQQAINAAESENR